MYKKGDLPLPPQLATTPNASQILCVAIPIVPVARHGICCERGHQYKRRLVETARPWASSEPAHPPSRKTQMSSRPQTGPHGASRDSILRLSPFLNREKGPGAGAGRLVFAGRRDCGAEGPAVQPARAAPWVFLGQIIWNPKQCICLYLPGFTKTILDGNRLHRRALRS